MNVESLIGGVLRGALRSRRKRRRRATRFLTGGSGSFLNASTLLAAAGLAWGAYETMTRNAREGTSGTDTGGSGADHAHRGSSATPPPLPASPRAAAGPSPAAAPDEVLRIVRVAISAAQADGQLAAAERAAILEHARAAGGASIVEAEIDSPRPLSELVAGVGDEAIRRELYVLAFAIVRADEEVSGAERIYLAQLAHQLGLAPDVTAALERETAAGIDESDEA